MFLAKDHAAFDTDRRRLAARADIRHLQWGLLKGGNTENCNSMEEPCRGSGGAILHPIKAARVLVNPLLPQSFRTGHSPVDVRPYFCKHRNTVTVQAKKTAEQIARYADMFSAMGTEARLRIMQLLLSAHPEGLVVGEIQEELDIPNSTLSHHLDKLRNEAFVKVTRESTFLR